LPGITRGLGTGGDPEIGRTAAEECSAELQEVVSDATIVFILAGLGGGTGSGALPVVADLAREQNAFVVVLGTLPFRSRGNGALLKPPRLSTRCEGSLIS
jgi:cell division protein FtsZ